MLALDHERESHQQPSNEALRERTRCKEVLEGLEVLKAEWEHTPKYQRAISKRAKVRTLTQAIETLAIDVQNRRRRLHQAPSEYRSLDEAYDFLCDELDKLTAKKSKRSKRARTDEVTVPPGDLVPGMG